MFKYIWLKAKTLRVLKDDFQYEPSRFQFSTLNATCKQALQNNVNEYDAAIMFIFVQINSLDKDKDTKAFIERHFLNIHKIIARNLISSNIQDVFSMGDEIAEKHGLKF